MSEEGHEIIQQVRRLLDRLDKLPGGDWVDGWIEGDAIRTDEAATIAGCSAQTIRRDAAAAMAAGRPIGRLISKSVWLISRRRLLNWIEGTEGLSARVEAEARAEKYKNGSVAPKIDSDERAATSSAYTNHIAAA
jgi:hypothetical protein